MPDDFTRAIVTRRLLGEPLGRRHEQLLVRWWSDPAFTASLGGPRPPAQVIARIGVALAHWQEAGYGSWIFRDRETGEPVGWAGLRRTAIRDGRTDAPGGEEHVELYYALDPARRRQGYGYEAASAVVLRAADLGLNELVAFILEANRASRALAEKLGFEEEGEVEHARLPHRLYRLPLTPVPFRRA